jgi:hypothetical protein
VIFAGETSPVLLACAVAALLATAVLVRIVKRDATGGDRINAGGGSSHKATRRGTHSQIPLIAPREPSV